MEEGEKSRRRDEREHFISLKTNNLTQNSVRGMQKLYLRYKLMPSIFYHLSVIRQSIH